MLIKFLKMILQVRKLLEFNKIFNIVLKERGQKVKKWAKFKWHTKMVPWRNHLYFYNLERSKFRVRRRQWHPTPVLLPGKSDGWRSLVGCSPWGPEESDTTERLHFHFSLSCIGEGNGNPLQCSCLENPRDGGAWWAAVYGVAQSQTRLKRLSSSSSMTIQIALWFCLLYGFKIFVIIIYTDLSTYTLRFA